jgi:2-polyprenyl-6-methoxyphenol hydroxylase-like FAD-dependent oxidoreductase
MDVVGLGPAIAALPAGRRVRQLAVTFDDRTIPIVDFSRLSGRHPYLLFLPQWDFLDLLASEAANYPSFQLRRSTPATDVIRDRGGRVCGVLADGSGGQVRVGARLTVACDGRSSTVRSALGLRPVEFGAPMDVLWFRLSRRDDDPNGLDMRVTAGGLMLCIDRGGYFQCAYVIAKAGFDTVRAKGLPALRESISRRGTPLRRPGRRIVHLGRRRAVDRTGEPVARMACARSVAHRRCGARDVAHRWRRNQPSPCRMPLPRRGFSALDSPTVPSPMDDLPAVARRRMLPTRVTQRVQLLAQHRLVDPLLRAKGPVNAPAPLRLFSRIPALRGVPARLLGVGVRPERVA